MGTLAMGFFAAWVAVAAYVGWLGVQQRRIGQRLDAAERNNTRRADFPARESQPNALSTRRVGVAGAQCGSGFAVEDQCPTARSSDSLQLENEALAQH